MGDIIVVSVEEHFMLLICHMIYGNLCGCSGDGADRCIPILTVSSTMNADVNDFGALLGKT
jgi:hypothetical protein